MTDAAPLLANPDFSRFGRAPARFDEAELAALNQRIVHMLDFSAMSGRLPEGMGEAAWEAIRPNLETVAKAADWWSIVTGPLEPPALEAEDRAFLAQAPDVLTGLAWDDQVWKALTSGDTARASSCRIQKNATTPPSNRIIVVDNAAPTR